MKWKVFSLLAVLCILGTFAWNCKGPDSDSEEGITDERAQTANAFYVGMEKCKSCHPDIYSTFVETGMGKSFDTASIQKSAAHFSKHSQVYDSVFNLHYFAFTKDKSLFIKQFRLLNGDTTFSRTEKVSYVVGSGQHTNSHILDINGYLYQMPMTFYTQKQTWDFPPGFEKGSNSRFNRIIGTECITCHNAFSDADPSAPNRFTRVPHGIDCERCHGPGSVHVSEKLAGKVIDTKKDTDFTIINPRKLSFKKQISVCQRCHLQGNTVLQEGKTFYDFHPGMELKQVMSVFLPRYKGDDEYFIMASHPDRLAQSKCFIQSKGKLACITCHNPHQSVKTLEANYFNKKCLTCHNSPEVCSVEKEKRLANLDNCVKCHMPSSSTADIPHVSIHDHFIRKRYSPLPSEKGKRVFSGITSINDPSPSPLTRTKAWIQYFERFDAQKANLDSARYWLEKIPSSQKEAISRQHIHILFLENKFDELINQYEDPIQWKNCQDAWTLYRLGEAAFQTQKTMLSIQLFERAVSLQSHDLDFLNKLAAAYIQGGKLEMARETLSKIKGLQPFYVPALVNTGYLDLLKGDPSSADYQYSAALRLDPVYLPALLNQVGLYLFKKENAKARKALQDLLKIFPDHSEAKKLLTTLPPL